MTVEIRIAGNADKDAWDTIVSQSPHGTIFHRWDWLKIARNHTNLQLFPVFGMKDGEVIGIFPLFFQKRGPVRMVFSPPPHCSIFYLGPVLKDSDARTREKRETRYTGFQHAVESFITEDLKANYVRISLSPGLEDPRPFLWSGYKADPGFDYAVDLTRGLDALYKSIDKQDRSSLRKAKEKGMTFSPGTKKECGKILDLMQDRYMKQGKFLTEPKQYFLDIYDAFRENLVITTVTADGEIVTGSIDILDRDTLYGWVGNPKPVVPMNPSPNNFLFWETIRYACETGCKTYTTMSAAGNKKLYKYYAARFNPELRLRYSLTRRTMFSRLFELGYFSVVRPLRAAVHYRRDTRGR